jgi:hypothetical protein
MQLYLRVGLVNQGWPISDCKQEISGEDKVEAIFSPCPWSLDIINLEVAVWWHPEAT